MPDTDVAGSRKDQRVHSSSANSSRNPESHYTREKQGGAVLRATTISFTGANTIGDSGNSLAQFSVGMKIRVTGTTKNDRSYKVMTSAAGTLTVLPAVIQNESAGNTFEIRQVL